MRIFGDVKREKCSVCHGKELENVWKIPLSNIEKISVNGANLSRIPLLNSEMIYHFSKCKNCNSILLDPFLSSYWDDRRELHHVNKAKNRESWDSYVGRIEQCLPYIKKKNTI